MDNNTPEYKKAYKMLDSIPLSVIEDYIWENDNDWVKSVAKDDGCLSFKNYE